MADHSTIDHTGITGVGGGISSGTAFPGSPSDNDLFFRTDRDILYTYRSSGTRWVSVQVFHEGPQITVAFPGYTGAGAHGRWTPWHTDYSLWIEVMYATIYVATTNNGSNYWTCTFTKYNAANSPTTVASFTTAANAANTYITKSVTVDAVLDPASHVTGIFDHTLTGSPGALYVIPALRYRLIG